jgi:sulfhydrogenase subunit beta (sulfur reductase)
MIGAGWRLSAAEVQEWLEWLLTTGRRVVAPAGDGGLVLFRQVRSVDEVRLQDTGHARWSPKEFLFPRTETLMSYTFDDSSSVRLAPPRPAEIEQVLFGVQPCDAAGLVRLDDVFLSGEDGDELYADRRRRTAVVSLACAVARPECFCTAVGGAPDGTDGSDAQLLPLPAPGGYLLRALTPKGRELLGGLDSGWQAATENDWAQARAQAERVATEIGRSPLPDDLPGRLMDAFGLPVWSTLAERCLGCGICAYVCPSCSCFDITDQANAYCGTRCRSWDTCTLAGFTRHASGHNPRTDQPSRYRQRVLHKFAYFPLEREGRLMCVGCGRCVALCPVGIDIRSAVETTATEAST